MHISSAGLRFIEGFEGFSSKPYWDSLGRVWTRGFGETEGIHASSPAITVAQGTANLRQRIERFYEPSIRAMGVPTTQDQWDACCSIGWNIGIGIFEAVHDFGRLLRGRHYLEAANSMLEYDKAGGVTLPGLARRRAAERKLFLSASAAPKPFVPADEQRWEHEWDVLKGKRFSVRRRALKRRLVARRKAIYTAATSQRNGWHVLNRLARYNAIKARTP